MPSSAIQSNPFYQPARQWQIRICVMADHIGTIGQAFEDLAIAISSFEVSELTGEWVVDIVTDTPPEHADIPSRLALASGMLDIPSPAYTVHLLEAKDWVGEVEKSFPPLHVGRFYVYGAHITTPPPQGKIALKISAGAAFGSGEHATTSGCLVALGKLARCKRYMHTLDMGCGSGILAIAMAKLWRTQVLGVDIDPISVTVARENAFNNRVQTLTRFEAGNAYRSSAVQQHAPFDCIVANILARPLMRMAPDLAENLAPGGIAILSGLLATQERMVLTAHRLHNLKLLSRISQHGWNTLILKKSSLRYSAKS